MFFSSLRIQLYPETHNKKMKMDVFGVTPSRWWDVRTKSSGDKVAPVGQCFKNVIPKYSAEMGGIKAVGEVKERKVDARNARKRAEVELV